MVRAKSTIVSDPISPIPQWEFPQLLRARSGAKLQQYRSGCRLTFALTLPHRHVKSLKSIPQSPTVLLMEYQGTWV